MKHVFSAFVIVSALLSGSFFSAARAAPCDYDVTPLPTISSEVSRVTGDGVLLRNGQVLILPESLLPYVRLNKSITVRGLKSLKDSHFLVFAIEAQVRICPSREDIKKGAYPGSSDYDVIRTQEMAQP